MGRSPILTSAALVGLAFGCSQSPSASETQRGGESPGDETRVTEFDQPPEAQANATAASLVRAHVKLVVLGEFPRALTGAVARTLEQELQVSVEPIEDVPLPDSAYYPPRRRYRADRLLTFLNRHLEGNPSSTRVLGLTSVDISTTKPPHRDWGVFGLGELGGRSCVISTYRLGRRARDEDSHLEFRVVTTAVHEVGHTLGLEHCTEPACVMRDAEGSITTVDTSDGHLHPGCRAELERESPRAVPDPTDSSTVGEAETSAR